jgi:hypothetical protein
MAIEDRLTAGSVAALAYLLDVPVEASLNGGLRGRTGRSRGGYGYDEEDGYIAGRPRGGIPRPGGQRSRIGPPRNRAGQFATTGRPGATGRPSLSGRPSLAGPTGGPQGAGAGSPAPEPPPQVDPRAANIALAKALWTPELVNDLATILQGPAGAGDQLGGPNPLRLLGTIPIESTRQVLHQHLELQKNTGPQQWADAGLLGSDVADPAILVLVKDVHHKASKGTRRRSPRASGGRYGYGGGETSRGGRGLGGESAADQDDWLTATKQMAADLCARFADVTGHESSSVAEDGSAASTTRPGGIPIRLHKSATIEAEYHTCWPADAATKMPGVNIAPLELHYIRAGVADNPRLVPSHYRRQVKDVREDLDGSITWYGGFERDRDKGTIRSVDIRIAGIDDGNRSAGGGEMTVEILTVEIPDGKPRAVAEPPATSDGATTAAMTRP